jgi:hypothetical protein
MKTTKLGDLLGKSLEEDFAEFDLTEIQLVLAQLANVEPIDLAHAELLQQQALRGADVITEFLGKIAKTVGYLEARINSTRNKVAFEYQSPDGGKTTADMRKLAAESSDEVEKIHISLSKAKASKIVLEKKFDLLIKSHYHYKEIGNGLKKTVLGTPLTSDRSFDVVEGYE